MPNNKQKQSSDKNKKHYLEAYHGDIKIFLNSFWWVGKPDFDIVNIQLYIRDLQPVCDRQVFLCALENVLGRAVGEKELEDQNSLIVEFEAKYSVE